MVQLFIRVFLSALTGSFVAIYLYYGEIGKVPSFVENQLLYTLSASVGVFIGLSLQFAEPYLNRVFRRTQNAGLRLATAIPFNIALMLLIVVLFAQFTLHVMLSDISLNIALQLYRDISLKLVLLVCIIGFIYSLVEFTYFSYNEYAVGQIEKMKVQRRQLELQFEALKNQLSPHYLFNSLNTISSLAMQDADLAENFIRKLTLTYQYILGTRDKKLIPTAEEIDFLKAYHFLLQVRFEDALQLRIQLSEGTLQTAIPPLTLQILLENAVKHNVISDTQPLTIEITEDAEGYLLVRNNFTETPTHTESLSVGLDNIRKRYLYFTHQPIQISESDRFEVRLPLLIM